MTVNDIDVESTIKTAQQLLAEESQLSPALRTILGVLIMLVQIMAGRLNLNSRNSSKPPSSNRFGNGGKGDKEGAGKKTGGQPGRIGTTLEKIDNPDVIKPLTVDRSLLPPGDYTVVGFDSRQVFDIDIRRVVIEYPAEILENQQGQRFTALFPAGVTKAVQYGNGVKAQSVYLSQYQLIPYNRVQEHNRKPIETAHQRGVDFYL